MAKASFVAARGFGTEVVILNDLCRDRLGLQCCVSVVPLLCRILSHTPLPAVQTWAVLRTATTSRQKTYFSRILESVCQFRRIGLGQICVYNERNGRRWVVSTGVPPLCHHLQTSAPPHPAHHICYTSGSCKALQLHLVQWDSTASGGVCNRNSEITHFPKVSWSEGSRSAPAWLNWMTGSFVVYDIKEFTQEPIK